MPLIETKTEGSTGFGGKIRKKFCLGLVKPEVLLRCARRRCEVSRQIYDSGRVRESLNIQIWEAAACIWHISSFKAGRDQPAKET